MTDLAVFVINLDGSSARLTAAETALRVQGTEFIRIPAVDGRQTAPTDVPEYDQRGAQRYFGRDLNGAEVGTFQSHLRALRTFLDTGAAFGLILEDDMDPEAQALAFVRAIVQWQKGRFAQDWHVTNLGAKRLKITTAQAMLEGERMQVELLRAHYFPMLATALLWTRAGAQAFLKQYRSIDCPWDHATRRWLMASDTGLATNPPLFLTTGATSQIDASVRRGAQGRTPLYRLRRMRRNWGDRLLALRHKMRCRPTP